MSADGFDDGTSLARWRHGAAVRRRILAARMTRRPMTKDGLDTIGFAMPLVDKARNTIPFV